LDGTVRSDYPVPVEPWLPAIRDGVGKVDGHDAAALPMTAPPGR
jgi:hypothetical protein